MSSTESLQDALYDPRLEIINNIGDPVIVFDEDIIVFANAEAVNLFGFQDALEMVDLKLSAITSKYEKKKEYAFSRQTDFLHPTIDAECQRFRWIHLKKSGEHFYSEVISVKLPEKLRQLWPDAQCVIISDLSSWNHLRSRAEMSFVPTRNLINNIDEAILIIDPDTGHILECNSNAADFYGYSVNALRTMNIGDINTLPPENIKEEMTKAKEEKRGHFRFKHRMASGEVLDVKVLSGPVHYRDKVALYSIVAPTLNALKPATVVERNVLPATEQNIFETLFHALQLPAVIFNPDMRIRAVNTAFLKEFEYGIQEVMNRHVTPLICPWEYIEEAEFFHGLVLKGNNIFEEIFRKSKSGRVKSYRVNAFPLMYKGGVSAVVSVYMDMDAEKRAFTKLDLINKIFESIDEGMLITNQEGQIIWVNHAFQNITGFKFSDAIGKKPSIMKSERHDEMFYKTMWHKLKTQGYWEGEIINRRRTGEYYQEWLTIVAVKDKKDRVTNYVGVMNDITKYKAQEEKIRHLAKTDVLTGLMNRVTFIENATRELEQTAEDMKHALFFIDLDGFKKINDTYGHDQGDKLLKIISYRLESTIKSKDFVARLGGDEFIVMVKDIEPDLVSDIASRILDVAGRTIDIEGHTISMDASIGIAIYPDDASTLKELMKSADIALYHAKESTGSSFSYYSREIEKRFKHANQLETCLKEALKKEEFSVYYQGIKANNAKGFACAEALIRWDNETLGNVSPSIFIPMAEKTGIMTQLGMWVIERVFKDIRTWDLDKHLHDGVAVNISVSQLEDENFARKVKYLLERYEIPPEKIEFEITESIYIRNFAQAVGVLDELRDLGISLTMDDFGTGYSSLSMIHKLKLSKIKIDRSFIKDLPDHDKSIELTNSIINLAKNLNFKVVAEGVENKRQVDFLWERDCDYIQGFYFSKPNSPDNFFSLITEEV